MKNNIKNLVCLLLLIGNVNAGKDDNDKGKGFGASMGYEASKEVVDIADKKIDIVMKETKEMSDNLNQTLKEGAIDIKDGLTTTGKLVGISILSAATIWAGKQIGDYFSYEGQLTRKTKKAELAFTDCLENANKAQPPVKKSCGLPITCHEFAETYQRCVGKDKVDKYRSYQKERKYLTERNIEANDKLNKCRIMNPGSQSNDPCAHQKEYVNHLLKELKEVNERQ